MNKEEIEKLLAPAMTEVAKTGRSVDAIADVVEKLEAAHRGELGDLEAAHRREIRVLRRTISTLIDETLLGDRQGPSPQPWDV